jgi:hypothetical protein
MDKMNHSPKLNKVENLEENKFIYGKFPKDYFNKNVYKSGLEKNKLIELEEGLVTFLVSLEDKDKIKNTHDLFEKAMVLMDEVRQKYAENGYNFYRRNDKGEFTTSTI